MQSSFDRALAAVLKHEGGWADHPRDPGGATNKGVTLATFRRFVKPKGTKADLKAITGEQVATVYRRHYWDEVSGAVLPPGIDYAVFDFAVNSGPSRAIKFVQKVVGVEQDGRIGPKTLAAVSAFGAVKLINKLCEARLIWLTTLKTWATFGKGWTSRISGVRSLALNLAGEATVGAIVEKGIADALSEPVQPAPVPAAVPTPAEPPAPATAVPEPPARTSLNWGKVAVVAGAIGLVVVAILGVAF